MILTGVHGSVVQVEAPSTPDQNVRINHEPNHAPNNSVLDPVILKSLTMHDSVTKILNGISLDLTFWGQLRFLKAGITQIKGIPAGFVKTFLMLE